MLDLSALLRLRRLLLLSSSLRLALLGLGALLRLRLATLPGQRLLLRCLLCPGLALCPLAGLRRIALLRLFLRLPRRGGSALLLLTCGRLLRDHLLTLRLVLLLALRLLGTLGLLARRHVRTRLTADIRTNRP